jgi:hypothetical protein
LAYFAVGVGSEGSIGGRDVSNHLSFAGTEKAGKLNPIGNSGYSLGTLQTDLGAHPEVSQPLVAAYQAWAKAHHSDWVLDSKQEQQTVTDLGRSGNAIRADGNRALDATVKSHLDEFLKSNAGKTFVHERDERQINLLTRPDSVLTKLQSTQLYQSALREDQARLATIALKVENQTGGGGAVWKHEKNHKPHRVVDGLVESINKGEIKGMGDIEPWVNKHPKYVRDGVAHALQGTETYLRLERTDLKSDLHRAWDSVKANATMDPGKLDPISALARDYATVKDQFLHPDGHHRGKHSTAIGEIQTKLGQLGYSNPDKTPLATDGHMGRNTRGALKVFQHEHHLKETGTADSTTLKALDATLKEQGVQRQAAPTTEQSNDPKRWGPSQITDPAHPGNTLFKQAQAGMQAIDAKYGRTSDHQTDNAAGHVALKVQCAGMKCIDHLLLGGTSGEKIIAVQGKLGSGLSKVVSVDTVEALNTPLAQSSQASAEVHAQQQSQRAQQVNQPVQVQAGPVLA